MNLQTLSKCGAHLGLSPSELGDLMVGTAGQNKLEMLENLVVAGADPDVCSSSSGNSALHAAVEVGRIKAFGSMNQHSLLLG